MNETKRIKGIVSTVRDVTKDYCGSSTVHGLGYFYNSRFNILERFFWVCAVTTMATLAVILINSTFVDWNDNPTMITIASTNNPVSALQFPTVTICNDFTPDRFGFVRNFLNTLEFQETEAVFGDSIAVRTLYEAYIDEKDKSLLYPNSLNGSALLNAINTLLLPPSITDPLAETAFLYGRFDLLRHPITGIMDNEGGTGSFYNYMGCKLVGSCSNYDIMSELGVATTLPDQFYGFTWNNNDFLVMPKSLNTEGFRLLATTYTMLALSPVGNFGTYLYNYKMVRSFPTQWLNSPETSSDDTPTVISIYQVLFNTMLNLGNYTDLKIIPTDISAILSPAPSYAESQKYPRQFPATVTAQLENNNGSDITSIELSAKSTWTGLAYTDQPTLNTVPLQLTAENYFGEVMGPYLKQVMEVMFHCTLRAKPISPLRFLHLNDIYGNVFNDTHVLLNVTQIDPYIRGQKNWPGNNLIFPINIFNQPFAPQWSDYQAINNATPYFWISQSLGNQMQGNAILLYENIPYPRNNIFYDPMFNPMDTIEDLKLRYQYQQMLAYCTGPGTNRTCYDKFQPILTDTGICHSFNAQDFNSTFAQSAYNDVFQYIYQLENNNSDILINENNGNGFQLFLVLDSFQSKVFDNDEGTFTVGISNLFSFMGMREKGIKVTNGHITTISVTPVQYKTTDAFRNLDMSSRNCRYMDEFTGNTSLFNFYSQEACNFECRLNNSREACNCTPWNYPQYGNDNITVICDGVQSYCFETAMGQTYDCGCLPDCETVTFTTTVDKVMLSYGKECYSPAGKPFGRSTAAYDIKLLVGEKLKHMDGEEFLFWYNQIMSNNTPIFDDIVSNNMFYRYMNPTLTQSMCESLLQNDFALLSIQVATPKFTIMVSDVSATFSTKIADIGGTLGLFTGMSIISLFELGFLLYRIATSVLCKAMKVERKGQAKK